MTLDGSFRYYFTPAFAFDVNAGFGDDVTSCGASVQVYFDR
jgi:hypothetical protein